MPPTPASIEEIAEIKRSYVTEEHFNRITDFAGKTRLAVSFREAGVHTLQRVTEGCGLKPHTILEKSIKETSILGLYPENEAAYKSAGTPELQQAAIASAKQSFEQDYKPEGATFSAFDALKGYIGAWDKVDGVSHLKGIYITEQGKQALETAAETASSKPLHERSERDAQYIQAAAAISPRGGNGHHMLRLDFTNTAEAGTFPIQSLGTLREADMKLFFTGDYDLHEMAGFSKESQKPHHMLADSPEEKAYLHHLSHIIQHGRLHDGAIERDAHFGEYSLVQHGPQESFIAHMMKEERTKPIPESVARMSSGVAMCDRGTWYLFRTPEAIREWYTEVHLPIKSTWATDDARLPQPVREPELLSLSELNEEQRIVKIEEKKAIQFPKEKVSETNKLIAIEANRIKTMYDIGTQREQRAMAVQTPPQPQPRQAQPQNQQDGRHL